MEQKLIKEIRNEVAYIWINRPDKKNAMDFDVWFGIPDLVNEINEKEEAKCILLLAKGDSFSAGIDIATFMGGKVALHHGTKLRSGQRHGRRR